MTTHEFELNIPRWDSLPAIGLYMDQVIRFVNDAFEDSFSKIGIKPITKSMINNYVKAKLVEAPEKKRYSREALAMIIVVYMLKCCWATEEVGKLINMGLRLGDNGITYNRFCDAMEATVSFVFAEDVSIKNEHIPDRENKYLMSTFALPFACKCYAQITFLEGHVS
jgi:hypothetical protein